MLATRVNINCLKLPSCGVCILWEWEWILCDTMDLFDSPGHSREMLTHDESDKESVVSVSDESSTEQVSPFHTVTFKCIGASRSMESQDALKNVSELLKEGLEVPVNIFCEPSNPFDARAIAFRCLLNEKWITIGYIVREAVEYVHSAIHDNVISDVRFAWVKYLVSWSCSGPGYYAGIDITIKGQWARAVVQCASTR